MCDTHEGSSWTQWEFQNPARSQSESEFVTVGKIAWAPTRWKIYAVRICLTIAFEYSCMSMGLHAKCIKQSTVRSTGFAFDDKSAITGRLTGVESHRDQLEQRLKEMQSKKMSNQRTQTEQSKTERWTSVNRLEYKNKCETGKLEKEQGHKKIAVSYPWPKKADSINKESQLCEIALQASRQRWRYFHAEHLQPWE